MYKHIKAIYTIIMTQTKGQRIGGWVISGLIGLMMLASGAIKLSGADEVMSQFKIMFLTDNLTLIAVGEIITALLIIVPRTNIIGTLLGSAYFGGAIVGHMVIGGQHFADPELAAAGSYLVPAVILVLVWVNGFIRNPGMLQALKGA